MPPRPTPAGGRRLPLDPGGARASTQGIEESRMAVATQTAATAGKESFAALLDESLGAGDRARRHRHQGHGDRRSRTTRC